MEMKEKKKNLECFSLSLFESFNGRNEKFIILIESLSERKWNK